MVEFYFYGWEVEEVGVKWLAQVIHTANSHFIHHTKVEGSPPNPEPETHLPDMMGG